MHTFLNHLRAQAQLATQHRAAPKLGIVESYDPNHYAVKVKRQPEGTLTGWLPVGSPWTGKGWGFYAPPSIGDLVEIQFQEGNIEAGICCHRLYNDFERPLPVESGECWLVHQSGAKVQLRNDGVIHIEQGGSVLELRSDGTVSLQVAKALETSAPQWTHRGDVKIEGRLEVSGTIQSGGDIQAAGDMKDQGGGKSMAVMRETYNRHTHPNHGLPRMRM